MTDFTHFTVVKEKESPTKGVFSIGPLFQGFGYTLGTSLRRTLLSSLSGWAVTQIKVTGAKHLFASLKGVKEDVLGIILNIKQLHLQAKKKGSFTMSLDKKGPGLVTAKDIQTPAGVVIVNKDLPIAHLANKQTELKIKFTVDYGVGYSLAKEHKLDKMGLIAVDALYSPIVRVGYRVESMRVGRKTNFDKLLLEIETDGTIMPSDAIKKAAAILTDVFVKIRDTKPKKKVAKKTTKPVAENGTPNLLIDEFDLPLRLVNALKKAGYRKLSDFQGVEEKRLKEIKNVGEKSLRELIKFLKKQEVEVK